MANSLDIVVMAAGKGTRMRSKLPKVLHPLAGKPMLAHILATIETLQAKAVHVVVGHGAEQVKAYFEEASVNWILQEQQRGTADAVAHALPHLVADTVLVLAGDTPLISDTTLKNLLSVAGNNNLAILTADVPEPKGLGRIVRNKEGTISRIVEEKDASEEIRKITEINTAIMAMPRRYLASWLKKIESNNAQGEFYFTDIVPLAIAENVAVLTHQTDDALEASGINDRKQLNQLERRFQKQCANTLMESGCSLADCDRIDIRGDLTTGEDCFIDINAVFEGTVKLGNNVRIEANCTIIDSEIGDNSIIKANTHIEKARLADNTVVGPFARLREGSDLSSGAKIGNFVETKKATIGIGSKVNHLSYVGDTKMGSYCNIGAGTITCNYDGVNKWPTEIGNNVFVGSNSTLIAPVKIHNDSFVAAGTILTKTVEEKQLAVSRGRQKNIDGWTPPSKREKD